MRPTKLIKDILESQVRKQLAEIEDGGEHVIIADFHNWSVHITVSVEMKKIHGGCAGNQWTPPVHAEYNPMFFLESCEQLYIGDDEIEIFTGSEIENILI